MLGYVDSGKFFRQPLQWVYYISGVLSVLIPIVLLISLLNLMSGMPAKLVVMLILLWLVLVAVGIVVSVLWFKRAAKLKELLVEESKFVAIPALANFIQTAGEAFGLFYGVVGCAASLLVLIFGASAELPYYIIEELPPLMNFGFTGIIVTPVAAYVFVVFTRFLAESVLALSDIANNCGHIVKNTKKEE